jgi:hypothetical protein
MFFTVKKSVRIAGKDYVPCVCYSLPKYLELTVKKLAEEDKAVIHEKMVFFQNGKILPSVEEREAKLKAEKKAEHKAKKAEESAREAEDTLTAESETEGF